MTTRALVLALTHGRRLVDEAGHDLRDSVRRMRRSPGLTAVSALTLDLGIGATVAIFTVVNAVLLRPLPFPDSDRRLATVSSALSATIVTPG